jgi:rhodanese-related sulfurtransferase
VFFCASGGRTTAHAARLARRAGAAPAYVMAGGIAAWARVGQPVESGAPAGGPAPPSLLGRLFAR